MAITESHDFFVQWHLTERCNLQCKHCYQSDKVPEEITLKEAKDLVREVFDLLEVWSAAYEIGFSASFNITGGEPFLRKDLFLILEELGKKGFDCYLLSNGILVDREKARCLAGLGVKGVQVSIEGPEDIHENIRGRGSFSSSLIGIQHLLDAGTTVTLNTTLSEMNADYFMDMVKLSTSLGVQKLGFSRLVPSGKGAGLLNMMMEKERVRTLYEKIASLKVEGLNIITGDPVACQTNQPVDESAGDAIPFGGCAAGISGLPLLPDGTIVPCRRLPIALGNVRKDSLREVWADSVVLEALRDKKRYKGKCGRCERWVGCRGCRAIAYARARSRGEDDFLAEDPQCFIAE